MIYKVHFTEPASNKLQKLLDHLIYNLKNIDAAKHLLNGIDKLVLRLREYPHQFPYCNDLVYRQLEYKEAIVTDMNYIIVFKVEIDTVIILGVFHQLEDYLEKL